MSKLLRVVPLALGVWPEGVSDGLSLLCGICNCAPRFDYKISDDVWKKVAPPEHRLGVICLPCFDELATQKQIDVSPHLKEVQFTGAGKTIILKPMEVCYWRKQNDLS